ncbi:unnamed protein product [Gordionus sp. m RMFG-2023]
MIDRFDEPNQINLCKNNKPLLHLFSNHSLAGSKSSSKKQKRDVYGIYDDGGNNDINIIMYEYKSNPAEKVIDKYETQHRNKRIFYSTGWAPGINYGQNDWPQDQKKSREMSVTKIKDDDKEQPNLGNPIYSRSGYPIDKSIPVFPNLFSSSHWGPGRKRRRKRSDSCTFYNKRCLFMSRGVVLKPLKNHKQSDTLPGKSGKNSFKRKNFGDGVSNLTFLVSIFKQLARPI